MEPRLKRWAKRNQRLALDSFAAVSD